jgi:hypothetical protein
MNVGGKEVAESARLIIEERREAVCMDSLPPLRMAALPVVPNEKSLGDPNYTCLKLRFHLPDFIARAAMFTTTSGLASKMTNNTPIGQVTRYSSNPSSNSFAYVVIPVGDGKAATSAIPESMASNLPGRERSRRE